VLRPYVAEHDGVMIPFSLRANLNYEYWTLPQGTERDRMTASDRRRYLRMPDESEVLSRWLTAQLGRRRDAERTISVLVEHFQENHEYQTGAPVLDRMEPVDDFVLNGRAGHCERFASALAVLLRMRGVPARVALGWIASERNELGGFYNVRARHGHAWTEAWIEDRGWVICDATPYGREISMEERSLGLTVYEWIEYVWYSKIVEFDVSDQQRLTDLAGRTVAATVTTIKTRFPTAVALLAVAIACTFVAARTTGRTRPKLAAGAQPQQEATETAQHFYGRMLRILSRQQIRRRGSQTPIEFLNELEASGHPCLAEIRDITRCFCEVRYGLQPLPAQARAAVQESLRRLAKGRS
jgi:hypothetical protein